MSVEPPVDLLVLGGGPAGSIVALQAARAGLRVRLFDRARFPRHKPCGGVIAPRAVTLLRRAGLLDSVLGAGAAAIHSIDLVSAGGRRARLPYGRGLALARQRLDQVLLEAAVEAGADIRLERRGVAVQADPGGRQQSLRVVDAGGREELHPAAWIVGAGGSLCPVRQHVRAWLRSSGRAPGRGRARRREGARRRREAHARGGATALTAIFEGDAAPDGVCEMHLLGDGYCGVAAAGGGQTTVGMVLPADAWRRHLGDAALSEAIASLPALANTLGRLPIAAGPWGSGSLRTRAPRTVPGGVVLIGDALARMEPITGEGMAEAMRGAWLTARWLARGPDPALAPRLHRRLAAGLRGARRRSALAAALSRSPGAALTAVQIISRSTTLSSIFGRWLGRGTWSGSGTWLGRGTRQETGTRAGARREAR